jgi:hypothetical protein
LGLIAAWRWYKAAEAAKVIWGADGSIAACVEKIGAP